MLVVARENRGVSSTHKRVVLPLLPLSSGSPKGKVRLSGANWYALEPCDTHTHAVPQRLMQAYTEQRKENDQERKTCIRHTQDQSRGKESAHARPNPAAKSRHTQDQSRAKKSLTVEEWYWTCCCSTFQVTPSTWIPTVRPVCLDITTERLSLASVTLPGVEALGV